MNTLFQAKLSLPADAFAPEDFIDNLGQRPHESFVVSRDKAGNPKSFYDDLVWDFSAYDPDGRQKKLHFQFWGKGAATSRQKEIVAEIRYVFFCLIWRRTGAPLSIGTLGNYLSVLTALAHYSDSLKSNATSSLVDHTQLSQFITGHCSGWMAETLFSLLTLLERLDSEVLGFKVVAPSRLSDLKEKNKSYRELLQQHPPMPTRIYSEFIAGLEHELAEWKMVSKNILAAVDQCTKDPRAGRNPQVQRMIEKTRKLEHRKFPNLADLLDACSVSYFKARAKKIDVRTMSAIVGQAQYMAKLSAQTFSGMRDDEVNTLPYHCLQKTVSGGRSHQLIKGRTTKFSHGLATQAQWVTNQNGADAIKVAREIADVIYGFHGVAPEASPERDRGLPLFVSVGYLGFVGTALTSDDGDFVPGRMGHRELPDSCLASIEDGDLIELEHIDPHRAWRGEDKFKLGSKWNFTSHQTRRSLALYAQRSGLVSLPSLRRQLKHLTDEMSLYYARGSSFARNFIGTHKDHFGLEWQEAQSESSGLSYLLNVLMSDDTLFGGHGNWVQQRLKKPDSSLLLDRSVTLKRFKNGEMAYKETILGGCTNIGACDRVAVQWLHTACVTDNCKNLVGNMTKLDLTIKAQENMLERLDKASVEYRTELQDLQALINVRKREAN